MTLWNRKLLLFVGLAWMLAGCSTVSSLWSSENGGAGDSSDSNYQAGMSALEDKKYNDAIRYFRRVEPNSPDYANSLKMIESIPFQRAQDAYKEKNYKLAMQELDKVPDNNPNYPRAQKLRAKAAYPLAINDYRSASGNVQKLSALKKVASAAEKSGDTAALRETVSLIGTHLKQARRVRDVRSLVSMLESTLESQTNPEVLNSGLDQAFRAIKQFNSQPQLRKQLLSLIAMLKLKLQT